MSQPFVEFVAQVRECIERRLDGGTVRCLSEKQAAVSFTKFQPLPSQAAAISHEVDCFVLNQSASGYLKQKVEG